MGFNRAIGGGNGDAGEHKSSGQLLLIKERLILLIHAAADQLAGTGGTGCGPVSMWGFTPRWGARGITNSTTVAPCREPRPTMDTIASELLLMALLMAVVILSGRV